MVPGLTELPSYAHFAQWQGETGQELKLTRPKFTLRLSSGGLRDGKAVLGAASSLISWFPTVLLHLCAGSQEGAIAPSVLPRLQNRLGPRLQGLGAAWIGAGVSEQHPEMSLLPKFRSSAKPQGMRMPSAAWCGRTSPCPSAPRFQRVPENPSGTQGSQPGILGCIS